MRRFAALAACVLLIPGSARATDIYLQIQRGEKVMIALPDFSSKDAAGAEGKMAADLHSAVKDDLLFTRLFNLTQQGPEVGTGKIDFEGWGKAGADILITAQVTLKEEGGGSAQMIASVYELPNGNSVFQKSYRTAARNSRRLAHEFVADFLYRFTADRGVSQSKIVFSNNATGSKELYIIDYDGQNLRRLTSDKSLAVLPRFSADGKEIAYTSYKRGNPDLYVYSLENGLSRTLSGKRGLNTAASFSPSGKEVLVTLSFQGTPSLYLIDRSGAVIRRVTQSKSADTSSTFSPDGKKIVFVSDRPGWPQIYMMDSDGGNVTRLTETGYCDSPSWSPRGDQIAYSRGTDKGKHDIILQDLTTGKAVQLTENAGSNENPSFSPDGRFIVFTSTRAKKRELYIVSIDGTIQKKLADIPGDSFNPSWGQ